MTAEEARQAVRELAQKQAGEWQRLVMTLPAGTSAHLTATTAFYIASEWSRR